MGEGAERRQNVMEPAGITGADCKAPAGTQKIFSYPRPPGSTNGTDWEDWAFQLVHKPW